MTIMLVTACGEEPAVEDHTDVPVNDSVDTADSGDEHVVEAGESFDNMGFKTEELMLWPNGNVRIMGRYVEGKRDGTWVSYFETGIKNSENEYRLGEKHGKSAVWYESGELYYIGYYENNEKKGIWKFYDENGTLVTTQEY